MNGRLLILGATGRLGRALATAAMEDLEFLALSRDWLDLETATAREVYELIDDLARAAVINAAAAALVDECEANQDRALAVNATAPGHLAAACERLGVPLIHISTDYVFGDRPGPFTEDAATGPVQWYGETKRRGERAVLDAGGRACVARVSWLFDHGDWSFADYVLGQVSEGAEAVAVRMRQQSRPTHTPSLARWLVALAVHLAGGGDAPKILHPTGGPAASRAVWARALLDANELPDIPVVDQGDTPGPGFALAKRPDDSRLDGDATAAWAASVGLPPLEDWREAQR